MSLMVTTARNTPSTPSRNTCKPNVATKGTFGAFPLWVAFHYLVPGKTSATWCPATRLPASNINRTRLTDSYKNGHSFLAVRARRTTRVYIDEAYYVSLVLY